MSRFTHIGSAAALALLFGFNAHAQAPARAEQPWARATAPQQKVGGAYVTLTSPANDALIGGSSPVAGRVEVHEMRMDGTIMRMRELPDGLSLPAGQAVALTPGGFHIMLMDLKQPLVAGADRAGATALPHRTSAGSAAQDRADRGAGSGPGPGWRHADDHADGRDAGTREVMDRAQTAHAGAGRRAGPGHVAPPSWLAAVNRRRKPRPTRSTASSARCWPDTIHPWRTDHA